MAATLRCTVRGCALPLARAADRWACASAHSFDVSRHGYVNLLQPQDKKALAQAESFTFAVGATITVPAGTVEGLYTGEFDVTVQYP